MAVGTFHTCIGTLQPAFVPSASIPGSHSACLMLFSGFGLCAMNDLQRLAPSTSALAKDMTRFLLGSCRYLAKYPRCVGAFAAPCLQVNFLLAVF